MQNFSGSKKSREIWVQLLVSITHLPNKKIVDHHILEAVSTVTDGYGRYGRLSPNHIDITLQLASPKINFILP